MADIKKIKPSLPKGTRDFLPEEVAKRNYIFDTIKAVFRKYGFQQIDTPAFERLETLTGKYGEEGDKLLFKILNSGDYLKDAPDAELQAKNSSAIVKHISEKGLRYDLTVPLARYVVQHNGELTFPFRRFHIGPVWRADRPQKGRYQEFYQCDADVIGSTSLLNEVELTQIYLEVFEKLKIDVTIEINNRKVLELVALYFGITRDRFSDFTVIIDKLDKIGFEGVIKEVKTSNIVQQNAWDALGDDGQGLRLLREIFYNMTNSWDAFFVQFNDSMRSNINPSLENVLGVQELITVLNKFPTYFNKEIAAKHFGLGRTDSDGRFIVFNPYLARGLNYYTGTIWEVKCNKASIGSIASGGRYDNLTEMFGGRDMSGVGISFGIERIYDVMEELKLFPAELGETTKVLFVHFDEASEAYAFEVLQKVRAHDIASEIYPGKKKLDKQMNYANDKKIPFVVVIGGDEMKEHKLTFKNMASGEQQKLSIDEIIVELQKHSK